MNIKKIRLLQIIREEVELHEKNTFIFEEEADKDGDGELSDEESKKAIDKEIKADEDAGNLADHKKSKTKTQEDILFTHEKDQKGNRKIVQPKKSRGKTMISRKKPTQKLEIKIR